MESTTKYYKNVVAVYEVNRNRRYSKPETYNYELAIVNGNWINLITSNYYGTYGMSKRVNAKHFISYTGIEISESEFHLIRQNLESKLKEIRDKTEIESEKNALISKIAEDKEIKECEEKCKANINYIMEYGISKGHIDPNPLYGRKIGHRDANQLAWKLNNKFGTNFRNTIFRKVLKSLINTLA